MVQLPSMETICTETTVCGIPLGVLENAGWQLWSVYMVGDGEFHVAIQKGTGGNLPTMEDTSITDIGQILDIVRRLGRVPG